MKKRVHRGLPLIAAFLMTLPLFAANAQTSPQVPVQDYTWLTPPAYPYTDPQNNLLTNRQPGDPSQLVNGGWVGHLDSARVVFRLAAPKMIDFFSVQILDQFAAGIETPTQVFFTCFNDSGSTMAQIPIQARRQEGAFEIGNSTRLGQTCEEVALNVVVGPGYWVFLGEVSFFAAQDVKQTKSLFLHFGGGLSVIQFRRDPRSTRGCGASTQGGGSRGRAGATRPHRWSDATTRMAPAQG